MQQEKAQENIYNAGRYSKFRLKSNLHEYLSSWHIRHCTHAAMSVKKKKRKVGMCLAGAIETWYLPKGQISCKKGRTTDLTPISGKRDMKQAAEKWESALNLVSKSDGRTASSPKLLYKAEWGWIVNRRWTNTSVD